MIKTIISILCASVIAGSAFAALPIDTITDSDILPGQKVHFSKDTTYILKGMVFVDSGAELRIDPGTIIKAYQDAGASTPTLLAVSRGAKIFAEGTQEKPIIFTWHQDDVTNPNDDFEQLDFTVRSLWGGIIICGRAPINTPDGYFTMEGIPSTETRAVCGGGTASDPNDTSGVLKFVSIRYGGYILKEGSEVNGLTLGAVGRGTKIEYVEVYNNSDDGFEMFGGTVNLRYCVSAFNGDDGFDYDEGWTGRGQYLFSITRQDAGGNSGDCGGEHDGGGSSTKTWISNPVISNTTYISTGNAIGMVFKEQAGGSFYNLVNSGFETGLLIASDADAQFKSGLIVLKNGVMKAGQDFVHPSSVSQAAIIDSMANGWNVKNTDPMFRKKYVTGFPPQSNYDSNMCQFDFRPKAGSPAVLDTVKYDAVLKDGTGFIEPTAYMGAFDPRKDTVWMRGWTALDHYGFLLSKDVKTVLTPAVPGTGIMHKPIPHLYNHLIVANSVNNAEAVFNLSNSSNVDLEIYNMHGKKMSTVYSGQRSAGYNSIKFATHSFVNGQYVVRLSFNGKVINGLLSIVR